MLFISAFFSLDRCPLRNFAPTISAFFFQFCAALIEVERKLGNTGHDHIFFRTETAGLIFLKIESWSSKSI